MLRYGQKIEITSTSISLVNLINVKVGDQGKILEYVPSLDYYKVKVNNMTLMITDKEFKTI